MHCDPWPIVHICIAVLCQNILDQSQHYVLLDRCATVSDKNTAVVGQISKVSLAKPCVIVTAVYFANSFCTLTAEIAESMCNYCLYVMWNIAMTFTVTLLLSVNRWTD